MTTQQEHAAAALRKWIESPTDQASEALDTVERLREYAGGYEPIDGLLRLAIHTIRVHAEAEPDPARRWIVGNDEHERRAESAPRVRAKAIDDARLIAVALENPPTDPMWLARWSEALARVDALDSDRAARHLDAKASREALGTNAHTGARLALAEHERERAEAVAALWRMLRSLGAGIGGGRGLKNNPAHAPSSERREGNNETSGLLAKLRAIGHRVALAGDPGRVESELALTALQSVIDSRPAIDAGDPEPDPIRDAAALAYTCALTCPSEPDAAWAARWAIAVGRLEAALAAESEVIGGTGSVDDAPTPSGVDDADLAILRTLNTRPQYKWPIGRIAPDEPAPGDPKAIRSRLRSLADRGLVIAPKKQRDGWLIARKGIDALASHFQTPD
ncbi:MAG: hypothetical protein ACTS3F_02655 [Phycisphaerales bacterium]